MGHADMYICKNCGKEIVLWLGSGIYLFRCTYDEACNLLLEIEMNNKKEFEDFIFSDEFVIEDKEKDKDKTICDFLFESKSNKSFERSNKYKYILKGFLDGSKIFQCINCGEYSEKSNFHIESSEGEELFRPKYSCDECGGELILIDYHDLECPNCGEIMDELPYAEWD